MKACFLGLGYIGLPTAIIAANSGILVHGVDINESILRALNEGILPIEEPGLQSIFQDCLSKRSISFGLNVVKADVYVVAVPTPFKENYEPNIDYVLSACNAIFEVASTKSLIIIESTSPVGTTKSVEDCWQTNKRSKEIELLFAYCPERVIPGNLIEELENNPRIIGGNKPQAIEKAIDFYSRFVKGGLHCTNISTAEMCKLVENAFRDVNIAFANELSILCEEIDVNVFELISLANLHPRVNILTPGIGVGGHCIAIDPYFIISKSPLNAKLISKAREVNNYKPHWVVNKIVESLSKFDYRPNVAFCGLTYKPDIDDYRESPAIEIINKIFELNICNVNVFDPFVNVPSSVGFVNERTIPDLDDFDFIVVLVKHTAFTSILSSIYKNKVLFFS